MLEGRGKLMGRLMNDSCRIGSLEGRALRGRIRRWLGRGGELLRVHLLGPVVLILDLEGMRGGDSEVRPGDLIHAQGHRLEDEESVPFRDHRRVEDGLTRLIRGRLRRREIGIEIVRLGGSEVHLLLMIGMGAISGGG